MIEIVGGWVEGEVDATKVTIQISWATSYATVSCPVRPEERRSTTEGALRRLERDGGDEGGKAVSGLPTVVAGR